MIEMVKAKQLLSQKATEKSQNYLLLTTTQFSKQLNNNRHLTYINTEKKYKKWTTSNQKEVAAEDYQNTSKNGNQTSPRKLHIPAANWARRQPKHQQKTNPNLLRKQHPTNQPELKKQLCISIRTAPGTQ
jgi:hypothetical protein